MHKNSPLKYTLKYIDLQVNEREKGNEKQKCGKKTSHTFKFMTIYLAVVVRFI